MNDIISQGTEIEKKFEVFNYPSDLNIIDTKEIYQNYLTITDDGEIRIRKIDDRYELTCKKGKPPIREEETMVVNKSIGEQLLNNGSKPIHKWRKIIAYKDWIIELDSFASTKIRYKIAEVEFDSVEDMEKFDPPWWFCGETNITNAEIWRLINCKM